MPTSNPPTLLACVALLSACTMFTGGSPPQRASLDKHACQDPDFTPLLPANESQPGQRPILAGGTVASGQFLISMWLYCDPTLSEDDPNEPNFSEVRYLGYRSEWQYRGLRPIDHMVKTVTMANREGMDAGGTGPSLRLGDISTSATIIRTPSQVVARALERSQPVEFLITISAPEPLAAAILRVTFKPGPDGLQVATAEIEEAPPSSK